MTHEELLAFQDRYFEIITKSKEPFRTARLTNLMTDMEKCYNIPLRYDRDYEKANPEVMHLHKLASKSINNYVEVR